MAFVVTHRFSGVSMLRAGRLLATRLCARYRLTPQERANRYVAWTPVAVVTASLGGHPSNGADTRR